MTFKKTLLLLLATIFFALNTFAQNTLNNQCDIKLIRVLNLEHENLYHDLSNIINQNLNELNQHGIFFYQVNSNTDFVPLGIYLSSLIANPLEKEMALNAFYERRDYFYNFIIEKYTKGKVKIASDDILNSLKFKKKQLIFEQLNLKFMIMHNTVYFNPKSKSIMFSLSNRNYYSLYQNHSKHNKRTELIARQNKIHEKLLQALNQIKFTPSADVPIPLKQESKTTQFNKNSKSSLEYIYQNFANNYDEIMNKRAARISQQAEDIITVLQEIGGITSDQIRLYTTLLRSLVVNIQASKVLSFSPLFSIIEDYQKYSDKSIYSKLSLISNMDLWFISTIKTIYAKNEAITIITNVVNQMTTKNTKHLDHFSSMIELEKNFDVLCRKSRSLNHDFTKRKSQRWVIHEVDTAFINQMKGIPDAYVGVLPNGEIEIEYQTKQKVWSVGHSGAIQFKGKRSNLSDAEIENEHNDVIRYYGVIFPRGFFEVFGSMSKSIFPAGKLDFIQGSSINLDKNKVFMIHFERATKDLGQVHMNLTWTNMIIDGEETSHVDFFRKWAIGVVEFNSLGEIIRVKKF